MRNHKCDRCQTDMMAPYETIRGRFREWEMCKECYEKFISWLVNK